MSDLSYTVIIDKVAYTDEQLARYEYERTLHVLHEIKRLGADVRDGGRGLSHTDINWLEPERAAQICLDIRASLGEEGIAELFADVLADSDRRWKQYNEGYVTGDVHFAEIEIDVTGIGMAETMAVIGGAADQRAALATHPEHFFIVGDITMGAARHGDLRDVRRTHGHSRRGQLGSGRGPRGHAFRARPRLPRAHLRLRPAPE